ncbi:amidohydrolase family protein [Pseudodesulfovibrio sp. JC047]|uniref:amidohydrolase family protein n=1 Tax=Pseudodesulfovibrio sp. JC047 TaxID=2683199 RepID=UPI0013D41B7B|nr:amidohydrolase family protein [Pseudodesulfovibrio sp. JC047]NDV20161.1 amidohydrolase family protein [Pseudodesulfovibrio sp. JC047]
MRIDIHAHAFDPKIADKVLVQLEGHYGVKPIGTGKADDLIERLDRAGLDKSVVLSAATTPSQVIPANNWAIQLKKTNPRFIPFGTLHPGFDRNAEELDRLEKNGIQGLKFHPDFQGFRMDDESFFDVMELIQGRFICLFHIGDTLPPDENPSCPKKMAALRKRFPKPTMIAAHMGGYHQWEYAIKHLAGTDVYVDCSSVLDFVDDSLLQRLFAAFPHDHILFGSDYPLYDAATEIKSLSQRLHLTETQLDELLSRGGALFS